MEVWKYEVSVVSLLCKMIEKLTIKPMKPTNKPCQTAVISRFSFDECEPEIGTYVSLVWEDGSDCECVYNGLDKSILPLPTHWYYVK